MSQGWSLTGLGRVGRMTPGTGSHLIQDPKKRNERSSVQGQRRWMEGGEAQDGGR